MSTPWYVSDMQQGARVVFGPADLLSCAALATSPVRDMHHHYYPGVYRILYRRIPALLPGVNRPCMFAYAAAGNLVQFFVITR